MYPQYALDITIHFTWYISHSETQSLQVYNSVSHKTHKRQLSLYDYYDLPALLQAMMSFKGEGDGGHRNAVKCVAVLT